MLRTAILALALVAEPLYAQLWPVLVMIQNYQKSQKLTKNQAKRKCMSLITKRIIVMERRAVVIRSPKPAAVVARMSAQ